MRICGLLVALVPALLLTAVASGAGRPALTVWPARVVLAPGGSADVHVANGGGRTASLDVRVEGLALDLRGSPRVVPAAAGTTLLDLRPARLVVPRGGVASFRVRARRRRGSSAGDHPALVLLTARPGGGAGLGVRVRIGVAVEVRVPGKLRRLLAVRGLRQQGRLLELAVVNRGNVEEHVARGVVVLRLLRRGRLLAVLQPRPRLLLPGARGVVEFAVPRRLRGRLRAVVVAPGLHAVTRSFPVSF